jgi:CDP-diacylglycerol--glycerol-3-phosphate 3-phosphatidyltransferase
MASLYDLKPRFQAALRPVVRATVAAGVTANALTGLALAGSLALGAALVAWPGARWLLVLLPVWLIVRMALNAMDGMAAREHGQASRFGALFNEVADVASDLALYLPLAAAFWPLWPGWVGLAVGVAMVAEAAGLAGPLIGASRRYDGPFGKADRAALFGALGLLIGLGVPVGWWVALALGLAILAGLATIARRLQRALAEARGPSGGDAP